MRLLPAKIVGRSTCEALKFARFKTDVTAFSPARSDARQAPHFYMGVDMRKGRSGGGVDCSASGSYFEIGFQSQGSETYGSQKAGLYLRVAPNERSEAMSRSRLVEGEFGEAVSSELKPGRKDEISTPGGGYFTGGYRSRSRFDADQKMGLDTGFRAERIGNSALYRILLYGKAQGDLGGQRGQDIIQAQVGTVRLPSGGDSSSATAKFMDRCVHGQRITFDGAIRDDSPPPSEWQPFRFGMANAEFRDASGDLKKFNGLVMHYPKPPSHGGKPCLEVTAGIKNLGNSALNLRYPITARPSAEGLVPEVIGLTSEMERILSPAPGACVQP